MYLSLSREILQNHPADLLRARHALCIGFSIDRLNDRFGQPNCNQRILASRRPAPLFGHNLY
jgi:hypothetical protein